MTDKRYTLIAYITIAVVFCAGFIATWWAFNGATRIPVWVALVGTLGISAATGPAEAALSRHRARRQHQKAGSR